ncbi:MAG: large conductance mechanosensitive channel protein MscL [Candidatus Bipolaricaulota bacterium]|nr:large conductance mechanosensitive channel protein MscL [Candidatus Bipolaricaulota bacterium]MDW8126329.1 large conductance mechanosensitive channel protein MscL [Candidatus Bipolaricaulota bacterium]
MKRFFQDFRDFISRGNLVEIAVAFVLGAAFGAVVNSFIFDVVMPPIGKLVGNVDFSNLFVVLGPEKYPSAEAARQAGAPAIYYGRFINNFVNFLVIALVMFLLVRMVIRLRKPKEAGAPTTKECPYCKTQIPVGAVRCPHCTSSLV